LWLERRSFGAETFGACQLGFGACETPFFPQKKIFAGIEEFGAQGPKGLVQ